MVKYIIKRLLAGLLALFVLATITFFMMRMIPGSPFGEDNKFTPPEVQAALNEQYGLDKPIMEQYVIYLKNAATGDFGDSIRKKGMEVTYIIARSAPATLKVGLCAFTISIVVGLTLGIISALTKRKWVNSIITVIATIGVSFPSFLLAMLMMILFGVALKIFPLVGLGTPAHYVLPSVALAIYPISMITRLTRSSFKDVMNKDYITLAKSKGTSDTKIILKHGLKNALLPVITYSGPLISGLVTGSFVIESLFSIPGIGKEFVSSVTNRDYTLIMGLTIFLGAIVIGMSIVSDIISAIVDPRIKLGE